MRPPRSTTTFGTPDFHPGLHRDQLSDEFENAYASGQSVLELYLTEFAPGVIPHLVEHRFRFDIPGVQVQLVGTVDLIDRKRPGDRPQDLVAGPTPSRIPIGISNSSATRSDTGSSGRERGFVPATCRRRSSFRKSALMCWFAKIRHSSSSYTELTAARTWNSLRPGQLKSLLVLRRARFDPFWQAPNRAEDSSGLSPLFVCPDVRRVPRARRATWRTAARMDTRKNSADAPIVKLNVSRSTPRRA